MKPEAKNTPPATNNMPKNVSGATVSSSRIIPPSKARIGVNAPNAAASAAPKR